MVTYIYIQLHFKKDFTSFVCFLNEEKVEIGDNFNFVLISFFNATCHVVFI